MDKREISNTLYGLGFRNSLKGGVILDTRNKRKHRSIGSIYYCFIHDGYIISSQIKKRLYFAIDIPTHFNSAEKAWMWIKEHAIGWRENNLARDARKVVTSLRLSFKFYYLVRDLRVQMIVTQFLSAILLGVYFTTGSLLIDIPSKILSIILFCLSIFNIIVIFRDY